MSIKKLTSVMIRRIAAGEIIERPASILKELIENSIDARSSKIKIYLNKGGLDEIRVKDNGEGIEQKDLFLSIQKHTTSKIISIDDLNNVKTLGFRGEALSSISAVSKLYIESIKKNFLGWKINNNDLHYIEPSYIDRGTNVIVKSIFYNTPARYKFMKHARVEYIYSESVFKKAALSNFKIHFTLFHNKKKIKNLPICHSFQDQEKRVIQLVGKSFIKNTFYFNYKSKNFVLNGWIQNPNVNKSISFSYFFINGRIIQDKLIYHSIKQALLKMNFIKKKLGFILYLICDPFLVDINVHPQKKEIRFIDEKDIYLFIYKAFISALHSKISILKKIKCKNTHQKKIHYKKNIKTTYKIKGEYKFICLIAKSYIIGEYKDFIIFIRASNAYKYIIHNLINIELKKHKFLSCKPLIMPITLYNKYDIDLNHIINFKNSKIIKRFGIYISMYNKKILIERLPKHILPKKQSFFLDEMFFILKKYLNINIHCSYDEKKFSLYISRLILKCSVINFFEHKEAQDLFFNLVKYKILSNKFSWCRIIPFFYFQKDFFNND